MAIASTPTIAFDRALWPSGTLWQPRASLAGCLRATLVRNTVGADFTDAQRFNHFPAAPLCSLTWWFSGSGFSVAPPGRGDATAALSSRTALPGRWVFSGPQSGPVSSWCPGPAHFMMVLILPDALAAMTGLRLDELTDQLWDASEVLPADWLPLLQGVQDARNDTEALQRLEDFLDPRWQQCRGHQNAMVQRYSDWLNYLAQRAALSGPGRSLRQWERRVKRWSGLPMRELRVMERAEDAFLTTSAAATRSGRRVDWAQIAVDAGYSDQSHMIRASRRVTGLSPQALSHGIQSEEGFWAYRLWM